MNVKFTDVCKIARHVFVKYVLYYCNVLFLLCCEKHDVIVWQSPSGSNFHELLLCSLAHMIICNGRPPFMEIHFVVQPKLPCCIQSCSRHDSITFALNVRGESGFFHIRETRSADVAAICRVCRESELSPEDAWCFRNYEPYRCIEF